MWVLAEFIHTKCFGWDYNSNLDIIIHTKKLFTIPLCELGIRTATV